MTQLHKESTISTAAISRFSRVCVFCGSSSGNKESYKEAAVALGQELVSRNLDLVYGGGSIGLMGLISKAVHSGGRHVIGIIPKTLIGKEKTGETVGELRQVSTMHERKSEMARLADCFIAMPGGFGTLEEVLEVITWAQLGIHDKPIGLLNVDGYYDLLIDFVDKSVNEGFVKASQRNLFVAASNATELVDKMEEFVLGPDQTQIIAKLKWEWDAAAAAIQPPRQQPSPVVGLKALLLADNISPPPQAERKVCRRRRIDMPTPGVFCY